MDWPPSPQHIHRTDDLNGIHLRLKTPASFVGRHPLPGLLTVLVLVFLIFISISVTLQAPRFDVEAVFGLVTICIVLLVCLLNLFRKNKSHDATLTVTGRAISVTHQGKTQQVWLSEVATISTRGELVLHGGGRVPLAPRQSRENRLWVSTALGQWITLHSARQGARADVPDALHALQEHT